MRVGKMTISKLKTELIKFHTKILKDVRGKKNKAYVVSMKNRLSTKEIFDSAEFVEKIDNYLLRFYALFPEVLTADPKRIKFYPLGLQLSEAHKQHGKKAAPANKTRRR
jgi:hypothetical protein